jgi:hypothetical protein
MLAETAHDGAVLGRLREVEDDDESTNGSEEGVHLSSTQARTIEQLAVENALLRQAAATQIENSRIRDRATTTNVAAPSFPHQWISWKQPPISGSLSEETDHAIDELDELIDFQPFGNSVPYGRRFSSILLTWKGRSLFLECQKIASSRVSRRVMAELARIWWFW